MRKVSGSRPDGVQEKKGKKICVKSLGNMEKTKRENGAREEENRRKDSARARNQSSFIHTVLSISDGRGQVLSFGSLQGPLVLVRG